MKPPARSQGAKKKRPSKDLDEWKEGTADDIPITCKMEAHHKERKPGGRPPVRAGAENHTDRSASKSTRAVGDFDTPRNREHQANYAAAYRLLV